MIEKLPINRISTQIELKTNEVVDAVNKLHKEAENNARIRADHEHKIEELQVNQNTYRTDIAELKKELQTRAENVQKDTESRSENVQKETFVSIDEALKNAEKMIATANRYYLYVKYKHLIGKLCKFKWGQGCYYGILTNIKRKSTELPFESNGRAFSNCELVKPDDDIIYKGE